MPPTTASSRLRIWASSSALWRSSPARVSMDPAMESKVWPRTPTSSWLDTAGPHRQVAALDLPGGEGEAADARCRCARPR